MSELLRLLTKNERMSESLIFLSKSFIRLFLGKKKKKFARKTDERIPSPEPEHWPKKPLMMNETSEMFQFEPMIETRANVGCSTVQVYSI